MGEGLSEILHLQLVNTYTGATGGNFTKHCEFNYF